MILWKSDEELFELARKELFTALVGDVLDGMELQHQFLPPNIKPLDSSMVVIGRAMPVLESDVEFIDQVALADGGLDKPFGRMFEALDDLKKNEIYICAGASPNYALWGGLMSTRAMHLGATGAVVDGYSRDTPEILRLGFPTFSQGTYAQDQGPRGKVVDYRTPINFGGIRVRPGDVIYGDLDGVLVVPSEAVEEAFAGALEKARGENQVRKALENGMSSKEAFDTFGLM